MKKIRTKGACLFVFIAGAIASSKFIEIYSDVNQQDRLKKLQTFNHCTFNRLFIFLASSTSPVFIDESGKLV